MGLDRADPRPPYLQIAAALRRGVQDGRYKSGELLPSARALSEQYGVAIMTVRSAIRLLREEGLVQSWQGKGVIVRDPAILDTVPPGFPASVLAGHWLTCYRFSSGNHHADIAHVTAVTSRHIRAVNHPPTPRTEGRASGFENTIEAQLAGRHITGHWRNTSDTRYFGSVHLAVLPGETVMDGYYTGFASDIEVSCEHWKWVRLDPESFTETALPDVVLQEPSVLYELVMNYSQNDPPLMLAAIEGNA